MRLIVAFFACVMLVQLAGCEQALFPANLPRSQYERFTYQREGITPEQEESILGGKPGGPGGPGGTGDINLRSRLKPLSER